MLGTQVKGGSASADELHRGAVVVDARQPASVGKDQFTLQYADLLRRRGLTGLGVGLSGYEVRQILRSVDSFLELIAQNPGSLTLATRASHIRRAKQEGKLALFFATSRVSEGINALEDFRAMYRVGVREVQVTYQYMNAMGCGCGERVDAGLSKFGLKAVEEMNRLGILVDVAHCGVKTFADVVRVSQAPVIYSHGATRALRDHIRNLADDQIEMLAKKGGMVGIAASSHFLKERGTIEGTSIDTYLDHVDHVVKVAGVDHLGVGLDTSVDFDPARRERTFRESEYSEIYGEQDWRLFVDKMHVDRLGIMPVGEGHNYDLITRGLKARGYSDDDVLKILGGNFLRLFEQVCG